MSTDQRKNKEINLIFFYSITLKNKVLLNKLIITL